VEEKQLKALISLLDDTDAEVVDEVSQRILELGPSIINELERAWENSLDSNFQQRVEDIISLIQRNNLKEKFTIWLKNDNDNLIKGAILMARFQYPDLDSAQIIERVDEIKQSIWLELNENLTPLEKVNVFNQVFYKEIGFGGNLKNIYNPQNHFINTVLERKKGSPILLGLIYLSIAQRLDMPVLGVDLPYHFVIAYCKYKLIFDENESEVNREQVVFYINPINNGLIFSRNEIKDYLKRMKLDENPNHFTPVDNIDVVFRLFQQLKQSYENNKDFEKVAELDEFIALFP